MWNVPLLNELFVCELISQVYGVFVEYLSQLPKDDMTCLTDLIYDDNCQWSHFSLRKILKTRNNLTKLFAENVR